MNYLLQILTRNKLNKLRKTAKACLKSVCYPVPERNRWKNIIQANGKYIKQILTALKGNRHICLPREIQDCIPKSFY